MNDTELKLTQLLRTTAPEPPTEMTFASLRSAREITLPALMTEAAPRTQSRRWLPLVSAGAVAASVVGLVAVVAVAGNHGPSITPAGNGGSVSSPTASPTASTPAAPQSVTTGGPSPVASASTSYAGQPAVPAAPQTGPENGYQTSYAGQSTSASTPSPAWTSPSGTPGS